MGKRKLLWLRHVETGRRVPVEVPTVFGRSDAYYRYTGKDERPDRLKSDVAEDLRALNYVKLCSDDVVSRTHGLLEPALPGLSDLNSTNGTWLNGRKLPGGDGDAGPVIALSAQDRLRVGRSVFEVVFADVSDEELRAQVERERHAFVGADRPRLERARVLREVLSQRKGFSVRDAVGWSAVIANCYHLQSAAHPEGVAVVALAADVRGVELVLEGQAPGDVMHFERLLPLVAAVPGRKVLVLELNGDPSACEQLFANQAYEDMLLVTGAPPPPGSDRFSPTMQSRLLDQLRESVSGDGTLSGAFDDPTDGIEALIAPDTNILQVAWVPSYRGRLGFVFGQRLRKDDLALSHSLRIGSTTFRF